MSSFSSSSESSHHESAQPSATPAEAGVHRTSVSLSETFLDSSSRTRDSIPEQYRIHFDELRSGILAFCHEFEIPSSALSSKETFGMCLTSHTPRIPLERIENISLLFTRLEYLLTNKEPLKEVIEALYDLKEQYTSQVKFLRDVGILNEGNTIRGIDGRDYPLPTLGRILFYLHEQREKLETKRDQGFTKLLLVPFGMSLDTLRKTLKQFLLTYKQTHPDFKFNINSLWTHADYHGGADLGDSPQIVYNPRSFDPKNHRGKTKTHILENQREDSHSIPGWRVLLLQAPYEDTLGFRGIPREGEGREEGSRISRPDLEAHQTPTKYLSILQEAQDKPDSPYYGESGMIPEDWLCAFMTHLQETGTPLDSTNDDTESMTFLTGAFFPSSNKVPSAFWDSSDSQVCLDEFDPDHSLGLVGTRFVVEI